MSKVQNTLKHIRRSPYQALAAIMVIFLTFFVISLFTLISLGSFKILQYFEKAPQVIAFFEKGKDLSNEEIASIKIKLEETGKMASFKYVSSKEAEAIYREKNKDDPLLLELVNYKILPPSIEISATQINFLPQLKEVLEKQPKVQEVVFYEDVVRVLTAWVRNIRIVGLVIVGYLLIQSILVITTITAMKILRKREEIKIMKLIGASRGFITWPFIIEGALYGIMGSFAGWGITYIALLYATPFLLDWLGEIQLLPVSFVVMLVILGAELILGSLIGILSSFFAVVRFLRR